LARIAENKLGPFQFNSYDGFPKELTPPVKVDNGSVYIGQFSQDGKKSGRGIFLWPDGSKYIGYWVDN